MNFSLIRAAMTDEETLLVKRAEQMHDAAASGNVVFSRFLTPREAYILTGFGLITDAKRASLTDEDAITFLWGGYEDAERCMLCAIPPYLAYSLPEPESSDSDLPTDSVAKAELASLIKDELAHELSPLFIHSSGYVSLTHRDYLGALLGLGIDRSVLGDIIVRDDGAIVFAKAGICGFLGNELVDVGRDRVKITRLPENEKITARREFEAVNGTVASARLDAVLGELTHASRETAKELIRRGLVEHNYFTAADCDREVVAGDIISVKREGKIRFGKFIVDSIGELTSKGRCRFAARKYL